MFAGLFNRLLAYKHLSLFIFGILRYNLFDSKSVKIKAHPLENTVSDSVL